jgi:anaerobic selenocysteine-containing dehydrogenase
LASGPSTETLPETDLIILWGNNIVSTGVHLLPFIQEAKKNGAKVIVIDPRKTRTAMFADVHLQPRPGTDAALALGMMNWIVSNNLHDQEFLQEHTKGWQELLSDELPKWTLETVAEITGLQANQIKELAEDYASTKKSCIRGGWGVNRHKNSGQACRSIMILPCITGAWRERCGGVLFWTGEENWMRLALGKLQRPDLGDRASKRSINMVQIGQALADNIDTNNKQLDPPIKSLFVYNSDVANCAPNSNNVRKGLMRDDLFVAVHDTVWTDSCDYADIVLPADTQLERADLHAPWGHYIYSLSQPCIKPLGESVRNTEVFRMLAEKMGYEEDAFKQSDEDMIKEIIDSEGHPGMEGISYEQLKEDGWMRCAVDSPNRDWYKKGWPTETGKINIWSDDIEKLGQSALPTFIPENEGMLNAELVKKYPLQVLSCATHYFIGDTFQSVPRLQAMMSRPTIELNPADARDRGIRDGDLCRLFNDRGETHAYAVIIEGSLSGVCGIQKQFKGSNTPGGVGSNALTTEELTDIGNSPSFYSCMVDVEKVSVTEDQLTDVEKTLVTEDQLID